MVEQLQTLPTIAGRFDYLLLSPEKAREMIGRRSPGEVSYAQSEQSFTRRQLLKVEKNAIKTKLETAKLQANYVAQINQQLHAVIRRKLQHALADTPTVCEQLLNWSDIITDLIDLLASPSTTISKVEAVVVNIPWLCADLLKLVNQPQYRRRDAKGEVIAVDSVKTALSFIGIDNVKHVLPALIYKQTIPLITDPFPQTKHKVWEFALSCAVTAEIIAPEFKVKSYDAYILGLMSQLGRSAIIKKYFRLFEQVHIDFLRHAQKAKLRDLHSALVQLLPDPSQLIELINAKADKTALHLFEFMHYRRLQLCQPLSQCTHDVLPEDASPMTKVLQQARYYAKYRMLKDANLFIDDEATSFLAGSAISSETLKILDNKVLTQLPVLGDV